MWRNVDMSRLCLCLDNIGTQTVGGRTDMPVITRSGQYKYSSAVRNPQVVPVPAPMTRIQVPSLEHCK